MTLREFLSQLDTISTKDYLWVNPTDIDDYRISRYPIEGMVQVDNLARLSFGHQSYVDGLINFLENKKTGLDKAVLVYRGKKLVVSIEGIIEAYYSNSLDWEFEEFLEEEISKIHQQWTEQEVDLFMESLLDDLRNEEY